MITNFTDKKRKSKKKYENQEVLSTLIKTVDTCVTVAATSASITLSVTGLSLILAQSLLHVA